MIIKIQLLAICLLFPFLSLATHISGQSKSENKPFYVLTIPKAGTFLLSKMLTMLTDKKGAPVWATFPGANVWQYPNENRDVLLPEKKMEKSFKTFLARNQFHFAHFNFAENFNLYSSTHPEYIKIILIRDLRDVCISMVYYLSEEIEAEINNSNFDDKLMFVIQQGDLSKEHHFWKIEKLAKIAVEWIKDPEVVVCRFENLVGENGGGSLKAQQNQIKTIARALNINLTSKKLNKMTSQLFGVRQGPDIGGTYREGKIGSWQNHFKDDHKEAFNQILGPLQSELGYPLF